MYLRRTKSQAFWLTPNWWEASTPVANLDQGCQLKSATEQGCTRLCSIPWTLDPGKITYSQFNQTSTNEPYNVIKKNAQIHYSVFSIIMPSDEEEKNP